MSYYELYEKVSKARVELNRQGLYRLGFDVQIELSLKSYHQIIDDRKFYGYVKTEVDDVNERIHRGTIFNIPFVLTGDTDRVLIAKESADK